MTTAKLHIRRTRYSKNGARRCMASAKMVSAVLTNQGHPFHLRSDGVAGMAPTRASGSTPRSDNGSTRFQTVERPFDTLGS